ncbi:hypothetical protein Q3G72_021126 [Acer saccharum]|nr:hypothetical protein Q3G72_021126 [Acer saccharum]
MEDEKAAACYDELTRKGGGAARSMAVFSLKSLLFSLRVVWSSAVVVLEEKALDFRPNYARFRAVANKCGELFLCDMAHISGLVSAQVEQTQNHEGNFHGSCFSTFRYAQRRGINVLFELDVPRHALSWGNGYPSLWPSKDCQQPLVVNNEFSFKVIDGILSGKRGVAAAPLLGLGRIAPVESGSCYSQ